MSANFYICISLGVLRNLLIFLLVGRIFLFPCMYSMLDNVSFMLLDAGYLCIPINILVLCSGMCLIYWKVWSFWGFFLRFVSRSRNKGCFIANSSWTLRQNPSEDSPHAVWVMSLPIWLLRTSIFPDSCKPVIISSDLFR